MSYYEVLFDGTTNGTWGRYLDCERQQLRAPVPAVPVYRGSYLGRPVEPLDVVAVLRVAESALTKSQISERAKKSRERVFDELNRLLESGEVVKVTSYYGQARFRLRVKP